MFIIVIHDGCYQAQRETVINFVAQQGNAKEKLWARLCDGSTTNLQLDFINFSLCCNRTKPEADYSLRTCPFGIKINLLLVYLSQTFEHFMQLAPLDYRHRGHKYAVKLPRRLLLNNSPCDLHFIVPFNRSINVTHGLLHIINCICPSLHKPPQLTFTLRYGAI